MPTKHEKRPLNLESGQIFTMKLLAIDTTTEACSVALYLEGVVVHTYQWAPQRHAELILPMCEQILSEAQVSLNDLDAIAFGRGPGSFTGVRIGAGIAQGIALAKDLPILPVSSLAALAQGMWRERGARHVIAAIDARMAQIYWAAFVVDDSDIAQPVTEERVDAPETLSAPSMAPWAGAGSGWGSYADQLTAVNLTHVDSDRYPQAYDIAVLGANNFRLGLGIAPELGLPVYVRDDVAKKSVKPA